MWRVREEGTGGPPSIGTGLVWMWRPWPHRGIHQLNDAFFITITYLVWLSCKQCYMNLVTLRYKYASRLLIFNCTLNTEITKRRDFPSSPALRTSHIAQVQVQSLVGELLIRSHQHKTWPKNIKFPQKKKKKRITKRKISLFSVREEKYFWILIPTMQKIISSKEV